MAHRVAAEARPNPITSGITSLRKAAAPGLPTGSLIPSLSVFYLLASHPHIGRHRDEDLRPGLRSFRVGEYVIIYRTEDQDVLILHVFRGSRDIEALLRQQRDSQNLMNKRDLTERDICSKFIGPAVKRANGNAST
jgi:hypothetical protein